METHDLNVLTLKVSKVGHKLSKVLAKIELKKIHTVTVQHVVTHVSLALAGRLLLD